MVRLSLLAGKPFTAGKTQLCEPVARPEVLPIVAIDIFL